MHRPALLGLLGAITAVTAGCRNDETLTGYGAAGRTWKLVEIDGAPYPASATITFPEPGAVAGEAPCNQFSARQNAPYPWFELSSIAVTRRACPNLVYERDFLNSLSQMTLVEVAGEVLILSNDEGRQMLFKSASVDAKTP